jgi:glycosyltransferase involved in cell wall biosynthesis
MSETASSGPRVSVCLTHYNRPEKLSATLESLARQTRLPDEVFLWDDCSPDDPTAVAVRWKRAFPHFVYHRNDSNLNMPGNLNAVVSQATGDYIANLHDADEFDPRLIELWADSLDRYPSAGMVYCGLESPMPGANGSKFWLNPKISPVTKGTEFFEAHFLHKWSSPIWGTTMVRKSVYEKLLPFRSQFQNWADVDMWMRVSLHHDVAYVDLPLIKTDEGETPLRGFGWERVFIQHRMVEEGIRLYCAKTGRKFGSLLLLQHLNLLRRWLRHMTSGVRQRDLDRIRTGVCYLKKVLGNSVPPQIDNLQGSAVHLR